MEGFDPLIMKPIDQLSDEERRISEAFKRRMDRRKQAIKSRCNFFEVYRNRDLFEKE